MPASSIGDLLDRIQEVEISLNRFYARVRDETNDASVKLLTYYLSKHRNHINGIFREFKPDAALSIRKNELEKDILYHPSSALILMDIPAGEITKKQLIKIAICRDSQLIDVYRRLLAQDLSGEAKRFVKCLIQAEEIDILKLTQMSEMEFL